MANKSDKSRKFNTKGHTLQEKIARAVKRKRIDDSALRTVHRPLPNALRQRIMRRAKSVALQLEIKRNLAAAMKSVQSASPLELATRLWRSADFVLGAEPCALAHVRSWLPNANGEVQWGVLVAFRDRAGQPQITMMSVSDFKRGRTLEEHLLNLGFDRVDAEMAKRIRSSAELAPNGLVTQAPGWHGKTYVLPTTIWRRDDKAEGVVLLGPSNIKLGTFESRGSLPEWQTQVAVAGEHSSRMRYLLAASFLALLPSEFTGEAFGCNLFGPSSCGKSTAQRVAGSTSGTNGGGALPSLGSSFVGIEELVMGHRNNLLPLDEIGAMLGDAKAVDMFFKALSFNGVAGRPRERSKAHEIKIGAYKGDMPVIIVMSSERSLGELASDARRQRLDGEEVRIFDLPAVAEDATDVFDAPSAASVFGEPGRARKDAVDRLADAARENRGVARDAFLTLFCNDDAAMITFERARSDFSQALGALQLNDRERRMAKSFERVFAAAVLAIDYGILTWKKKDTLADIIKCLVDVVANARAAKGAREQARFERDHEFAVGLIDAIQMLKIISLKKYPKGRVPQAEAYKGKLGKDQTYSVYVTAKFVQAQLRDPTQRKRVIDLLIANGQLRPGSRSDTATHWIQDGRVAEGRQAYYVFVPTILKA